MGDAEDALRTRAAQAASDASRVASDAAGALSAEIADLRRELAAELLPKLLDSLRAAGYPGGELQQKRLSYKTGFGRKRNWATEEIATWQLFSDGYTFYVTSEGTFMTTGTVGPPSGVYQAGERCLTLAEWPDFSNQEHVAKLLRRTKNQIAKMIGDLVGA